MPNQNTCPCCKRPWPESADTPLDLDDTKDFTQAARIATESQDPRRTYPRSKKVMSLTVRVDGSILEAVTMDLSKSGARIFYLSNQIPVNAKVSISCEDILLNGGEAVAVWSKQQEKTYAVSGLRFV